jgi:hypothetical protein
LWEECRLRVFESRVFRRIFWPKRDEVTGNKKKLHNEELKDLHSSTNIIWVIKLRRMGWAGHVTRVGIGEVHTEFWWTNLRERGYLEDPGLDGRLILKMAIQEVTCRAGTGFL